MGSMNNILFTPHTTKQDYFRRNSLPYKRPAVRKLVDFKDHTEWTRSDTTAGVTISTDTTEHPGTSNASVKVAVNAMAAGDADKTWIVYRDYGAGAVWDIRDCTITIRYYCDMDFIPYGAPTYRTTFDLLISSQAVNPTANKGSISMPLSPGWHTIDVDVSILLQQSVDLQNIRSIGFYFVGAAAGCPAFNLWLDYVSFTPNQRSKAGFILALDDGYRSALTVAKMMHAEGFRSMLFLETNNVGLVTHVTAAEARELEKYGMLVCSHYNGAYFDSIHPQTLADDGAVHAFCRTMKQKMWEMGLRNGSEFFAIPGGSIFFQSEDHYEVAKQYFSIIRGTGLFRQQSTEVFKLAKNPVGAATNEGGGLVGWPCEDHGFSVGTRLECTASEYPSVYTVHANTTEDKIVVTAPYAAKTFTGQSRIYPWGNGGMMPQGSSKYLVQGTCPVEPWWRWAELPTNAVDGDYETAIENAVTAAIASKGIYEMYNHDFASNQLTAARLATLIAYLRGRVDAGELEVITYEDLL